MKLDNFSLLRGLNEQRPLEGDELRGFEGVPIEANDADVAENQDLFFRLVPADDVSVGERCDEDVVAKRRSVEGLFEGGLGVLDSVVVEFEPDLTAVDGLDVYILFEDQREACLACPSDDKEKQFIFAKTFEYFIISNTFLQTT